MKAILAAPLLALLLLGLPAVGTHPQTTTISYASGSLVGVNAGGTTTYGGTSWCITPWATLGLVGCLGGGYVHTHSEGTILGGAANCGADPDLCHVYQTALASVTDAVSGPNVYGINCFVNPAGGTRCSNDGSLDGYPDALVAGCGIALLADARGVHAGDHHTAIYVLILWADTTTSEVCVGTTGTVPVLFA